MTEATAGIGSLVGHVVVSNALDLLAPRDCAGCGGRVDPGRDLCRYCCTQLHEATPISVPFSVPFSVMRASGRVTAFAATRYEGDVRSILLGYKERGRRGLRTDLGSALFVACLAVWLELSPPQAILPLRLVPVPSKRATVRERGHDAVRGVATVAAAKLGELGIQATVTPALRHARQVADQSGLTIDARAANLAGALEVRRPGGVAGALVIVVDDIVTTGATVADAVRALTAAGAHVVGVAAIAATPRRRSAAASPRRHSAVGTKSSEQGRTDAVLHPRGRARLKAWRPPGSVVASVCES